MATPADRSVLTYYATPGPFTDLTKHAVRLRDLPEALPDLCRVVQGLIVHPYYAPLYGLDQQSLRQSDMGARVPRAGRYARRH